LSVVTEERSTAARIGLPTVPAREWADRLVGSDPGLNRFRGALQAVASIGVILGAEWIFVHFTHALQIQTHGAKVSSAVAAQTATANHEFLVIGMLLGAIVGMITAMAVMDSTAKGQLASMLFVPFPMVAALAFGISIGGHRVLALISLVVVLTVGTYCRRFGPRGFMAGMLLFMGDFFGFFLHGAVTLSDLGWLTAELGVGLAVAIAVRFVFFYPRPTKALARTRRSYAARARKVAAEALDLLDNPDHDESQVRRLHRHLVRLNEAALMIDAQLGDPSAVAEGSSAELLHQRLFDVELALTNVARFAQAIGSLDVPADQRRHARLALAAIVGRDTGGAKDHAASLMGLIRAGGAGTESADHDRAAAVVPHRFAGSIADLADAISSWDSPGAASGDADGTFHPAVLLFAGWLPGSAGVSATASLESGRRRGERLALAPHTRTAIQMGVAVGGAIVLGDIVSGRRFYWAVIAAFITFMGANNSGEQARKAIFRVLGTVVGIGVGSLVVQAIGHHTNWSIAIILVSLFLGFYLMRINYAFMVVGVTVMVSQLYVQLGEFSNSLLLLRLGETALGAAVAVVVVIVVLPLRTRRVLRVAMRDHVQAIAALVDHATSILVGHPTDHIETTLRADARNVDGTYQALVATIQPLRRTLFGQIDETAGSAVRLAAASRNYGRSLVFDVEAAGEADEDTRFDVQRGSETLLESLAVVAAATTGPREGTYTRSAALFDFAEQRLLESSQGTIGSTQLAVRDLTLLDGAMAQLAQAMDLKLTDYDTARINGPNGTRPM
jgi:uncharacterized membrane protein YgaE (UPF0421/DUF939 family)